MKHSFVPLLITSVIILTSLSDCDPDDGHDPYNPIFYTPISAEINGILYSDVYVKLYERTDFDDSGFLHNPSEVLFGMKYGNAYFKLEGRKVTSESGDTLFLSLCSQRDRAKFDLNSKHKLEASILRYDHKTKLLTNYDSTDGWIQFTTIGHSRVGGRFEFIIKDPKTDSVLFDINNGIFYLPINKTNIWID